MLQTKPAIFLSLMFVGACGGTSTPPNATEPAECAVRIGEECYSTHAEACAAVSCPQERCDLLESYPAQVQCQPVATTAATPEVAAVQPATLVGQWVADASCVSEMQGMEGADQATLDAVAAQIVQNHYEFTDSTMRHSIGSAEGTEEPYRVVDHEGPTWTLEMMGPGGATQQTIITIEGEQMRMSRGDALVLCLVRE